jgi:hypothetical protein
MKYASQDIITFRNDMMWSGPPSVKTITNASGFLFALLLMADNFAACRIGHTALNLESLNVTFASPMEETKANSNESYMSTRKDSNYIGPPL